MTDATTNAPSDRNHVATTLRWLGSAFRRRVAIDRRALATFRIALGALLVADLALRSRSLDAFYTDAGVLPRAALFATDGSVYSVHAISGAAWVQALLFAVAGVVALALLVGYRTRLATIGSWLLLCSLQLRNPLVLNAGDELLRFLLFWGIFLPLGARWSVDASRNPGTPRSWTVASVGTAAVLLQVVLMYATNLVHKTRSEQWMGGDALVHVFTADQFTVLLGNVLAEQHELLRALGHLWMVLLVAAPLLLLLTGVPRAVLTTLYVGMHLGMLVTMQIGLFPLIVVAGLLPFYPPTVWDALTTSATRLGFDPDRRHRRVEWIATRTPSVPALSVAGLRGLRERAAPLARARIIFSTVIPLVVLLLIVLGNVQAAGVAEMPDPVERTIDATKTEQTWRMFAPKPTQTTRWYVAPGTLSNGSSVDALNGGRVTWDRPAAVEKSFPTARWRKYLSNVRTIPNEHYRSSLARYLCHRWNRAHDTHLESLSIYYLADHAGPFDDAPQISRHDLQSHDCTAPAVQ